MRLRTLRLTFATFWVDVRLTHIDGHWVASADTPDGPSLGLGWQPLEALGEALESFDGVVDELLRACRMSCPGARPPPAAPDDGDIVDSDSTPVLMSDLPAGRQKQAELPRRAATTEAARHGLPSR
jgi:hypothetical protein